MPGERAHDATDTLARDSRTARARNFRMPQDSEGRRWLRRILASLPDNPSLFPHQVDLDQNLILMIEMGEPDYRRAAFLDERAISAATRGSWLPLRRLRQ